AERVCRQAAVKRQRIGSGASTGEKIRARPREQQVVLAQPRRAGGEAADGRASVCAASGNIGAVTCDGGETVGRVEPERPPGRLENKIRAAQVRREIKCYGVGSGGPIVGRRQPRGSSIWNVAS